MKKAFLFLLAFSVTTVYSQEYVNLFKNDLTERILHESFAKQTVDKELGLAVKIHPELLYYYITYYNLKYDGKVEAEYRLNNKELGEARSSYIKKRNEWFKTGEKHLKIIEKDSAKLSAELQYLNINNPYKDLTIGQICDSCYKTDKNRRDYFVYKYYMEESDLIYLPNEDYAALRKEYETKAENILEKDLEKLYEADIIFQRAYNDYSLLIKFWYLFPDRGEKESIQAQYTRFIYSNYYKFLENTELSGNQNSFFSEELLRGIESIRRTGKLRLMLNYNNFRIKSLNHQYSSLEDKNRKGESNIDFNANQIYTGLCFTISLSNKDISFSSISFEAGLGFNPVQRTLALYYPEELPPYTGSKGEELIVSYKMSPEKNNLRIIHLLNFSFKLKTPLFLIGPKLSLGIGGIAHIISMKYVSKMDFYFRRVWRWKDNYGRVFTNTLRYYRVLQEESEQSKLFFKVYPILTAEYKLPWNFNLNCEASLNYYVAGFSYNLL